MKLRLLMRPPSETFHATTISYAVATVLLTRLFLELAGYPQVGNSTLHIAHVLWGGLLMYVAGRMSLILYGEGGRRASAIVLGIGFGLFIDEVGKFITQDNDYFFRPAAAIIYVSFVLLFLAPRGLRRFTPSTDRALLCKAVGELEEVVRGDFELHEKESSLRALDRVISSPSSQRHLAMQLREILSGQEPKPHRPWPLVGLLEDAWERAMASPRSRKWVLRAILFFTVVGLLKMSAQTAGVLLSVLSPGADAVRRSILGVTLPAIPESELTLGLLQAVSSIVAVLLLVRGVWALPRDLDDGVKYLRRGLLVVVMFVAVFTFYFDQFIAALDVLVSLALLGVLYQLRGDTSIDARQIELPPDPQWTGDLLVAESAATAR